MYIYRGHNCKITMYISLYINEKELVYLSSLLYKAILSVCMYVRGLFVPTGHSFQDTDIWIILFDPKC